MSAAGAGSGALRIIDTSKWANIMRRDLVICHMQAARYGSCVAANVSNLSRGLCAQEFTEFADCLMHSMKKRVKR